MTAYNVIDAGKLVPGEPEDVSVILANLQAIANVLGGNLDNSNLSAGAAIAIQKLVNFPNDPLKLLKGDGSWGAGGGVWRCGRRLRSGPGAGGGSRGLGTWRPTWLRLWHAARASGPAGAGVDRPR